MCFGLVLTLLLAACKPAGPKAFEDGRRLLEKGRPAEAIGRLQVAADIFRTNAAVWNYLGIACHQAGQASNAITAYNRALSLSPDLMEARLNLGMLYLEAGQTSEARSAFTAYTLGRPNAPEGFERLAEAEMRMREFSLAEPHVRRALQLDDKYAEAWNTLGLIQIQRGRPRDAVASFNSALAKHPDFAPALLNLAIVTQQLGDRPGALKLYRKYAALAPRPADTDAVGAIIRQLEGELAPPRPTVAPSPAPQPIATKPVATNPAPAPKPVATTAPKAEAPQPPPAKPSPAPAATPVPARPRPAPTVVTLAPEPVIKSEPTNPQPVATPPASAPAKEETVVASATTAPGAPEKKSFLDSINPANLFRHSKPGVTPLPAGNNSTGQPVTAARTSTGPVAAATETTPAKPPTPAPALASPPPPPLTADAAGNFPRYKYLGGGRTAPGDRAAAQRFAAKGSAALSSQRYLEATTAFRSAVEADPSWFQAQMNFAAAALQADRLTESLYASETALALQPDSVPARYNFALALKRGNYVFDAANELEKLLAANPNEADAHLVLGNLCAEQLRQIEKARAHYLRVLELNPKHPRATAIRFWLKAHPK